MYRYIHHDGREGASKVSVNHAMICAIGYTETQKTLEKTEQSDWIFSNPDKNHIIETPFKFSYLKTTSNTIKGTIEVYCREHAKV